MWHSAAAVTAGTRIIYVASFDASPEKRRSGRSGTIGAREATALPHWASEANYEADEERMWGCGPVEDETEAMIIRGILGEAGVDPGVDQTCNVDAERDAARSAERASWTPEQRLHSISREQERAMSDDIFGC